MAKKSTNEILESKKIVSLDIGGGLDPQKNFVVMDERDLPSVDIIHPFEQYPWPFDDNSVDFIKCAGVLDRINPANKGMIKFMNECWRILKPDCQITFALWYGGSYEYFRDPCAVNQINEGTFAYFDPIDPLLGGAWYRIYEPAPWKIVTELWNTLGQMEVLLEKRRDDSSYHRGKKKLYE